MFKYWIMARTHISTPETHSTIVSISFFYWKYFSWRKKGRWYYLPKAIMTHQGQVFSREDISVECLRIKVHLVKESPKPASAPYRDAIVWQKHIKSRNPIQLNRKATKKVQFFVNVSFFNTRRTALIWYKDVISMFLFISSTCYCKLYWVTTFEILMSSINNWNHGQ